MNRVIECGNWEQNCESMGCSVVCFVMMASSNGNIFRVTGPLWRESIGNRWITPTKCSDTELMIFSLICASTKDWVNSGDLQLYRAHYDVTVMAAKRINMAGHWNKYFCFFEDTDRLFNVLQRYSNLNDFMIFQRQHLHFIVWFRKRHSCFIIL